MTAEKAEKGDKGKRWIGFQAPRLKGAGLVAGIAGLIPLFLMIKFMRRPVIKAVSKTGDKAEDKAEG